MSFISDLDLGLKNMVKFKGHWSEKFIRAFYTNLEYKVRKKTIVSEVRGKRIEINEKQLADILGIPPPAPTDLCFTDYHNSLSPSIYDRDEVYKTITMETVFSGQEIRISLMEASDRLLLNVITHILVNKPGNWACGSESEFFTMACIMKGQPINIPYSMLHMMASCARKKSPLPYAAFISKILKACNINHHMNKRAGFSIIDSNSLRRMNLSLIGR